MLLLIPALLPVLVLLSGAVVGACGLSTPMCSDHQHVEEHPAAEDSEAEMLRLRHRAGVSGQAAIRGVAFSRT